MKNISNFLTILTVSLLLQPLGSYAQTNMGQIRTIFQAKCASCHSGATPEAGLDLSGTEAQIYANIVNVASTMSESGEKLIAPGYPYRSFLLKKMNNGLIHETDAALTANEGDHMPTPTYSGEPVTDKDVELVRQWIYRGAKQTGTAVNKNLIDTYYTDGGFAPIERPAPPAAGQGFQIHLGPLFIAPDEEHEYALKYDLGLPENIEVKRLDVKMPIQSHHFILYKYLPGQSNSISNGLRDVGVFNIPGDGSTMVAAWAYSGAYRVPAGTAYKWQGNDVLDLNLHQPNPSQTSILPADVYINVYTQPNGTAIKEMKSDLVTFNSPFFFVIPGNAINYPLEETVIPSEQRNIWNIGPHTHKYGVDFDVWRRNPNGTKGEQIFEGQENGYYDWEHPNNGYYEPYYILPANTGFIHRALYTNTSSSAVTFGLTTDNEMMITYMQYTEGEPLTFVGVPNIKERYCVNADPIVFQPTGGTITGNGTSGNQFLPSTAGVGTHSVTYTYHDPTYNENITAEYDITVTPALETPSITNTDNVLSTSGNYESYQWYVNGNAIPNATLNYYVPTTSGNYMVAIMQDGCLTFSGNSSVVFTGIANAPINQSNVWVYPNPYQNEFRIQYQLTETSNINIALYNTIGQQVATIVPVSRQTNGTYNYHFDAQQLPTGVYFLQTTINGKTYLQKLVQN